jgi:hypothetical protein
MLTLAAIKVLAHKAWVWCKANWKLLVGLAIGLAVMLIFRKGTPDFTKLYRDILEVRQQEYDDIDEVQADLIRREEEAAQRALEAMRQVEADFAARETGLEEKKRREIQKAIDKAKNNPDELARELAKLTGVTYVPRSEP